MTIVLRGFMVILSAKLVFLLMVTFTSNEFDSTWFNHVISCYHGFIVAGTNVNF